MSAVTNFTVSGLTAYVEENRDLIIGSFGLANRDTRSRIGIQTGVKGSMRLHYLGITPVIQDGSSCGFNAQDAIALTERTISVAIHKVDGQICPETLIGKYAEYLVKVNARDNDLPYEQYIVDTLVEQVNKAIETEIWQGKTSAHSGTALIDGFIYQFDNDASVVDVTLNNGESAYEGISKVYAAMTEETLERGGVIFVSPAIFRSFMMEMVALNLYHYAGAVNDNPDEFILPGSDVRVIKTPGLASSLKIVGTFAENLVYGTDMEGDEEKFDLWWSQDDRLWKYQIKWAGGVSYHFPAQVVLGTYSAAPTAPTPGVVASGQIAANTAQIAENTTPTS